jgi:hypothetical protein
MFDAFIREAVVHHINVPGATVKSVRRYFTLDPEENQYGARHPGSKPQYIDSRKSFVAQKRAVRRFKIILKHLEGFSTNGPTKRPKLLLIVAK